MDDDEIVEDRLHGHEFRARKPSRDMVKQREAVRLRDVEGLTFQEIAEQLGLKHRSSAQRLYTKGVAAGDFELTDDDHRRLLIRRYEWLWTIAAKRADRGDLVAVREAAKILDKIDRIKQLGMPMPGRPRGDAPDHDGDDVVVGPNRLEQIRQRKEERARTSGGAG